ncbi:carboxymuconolactone decarboxylase family protein [Saccharothrix obliqua]|uniref:carboxymuconolactone decarboxylase family protein n=1 Tax=Saccharothrix obliqua TaxID=2861747 RepID=UPI001C5DEA1D|nr:carboxymuconolactone decarboxylase family protein [Saccharothrix obliqua]MBW4718438.1 carboxymuconolactone decarboxylase family protein [Saccharothrix obliqua]
MTLDPFAGPGYQGLLALHQAVDADAEFPAGLLELLRLRCSRLNGCSYCTRLHSGQALAAGESRERVDHVDDWRTHPAFTPAERTAFALVDAVTLIRDGVPEDVRTAAIGAFGEPGVQQLIWLAVVVNSFNRMAVGMGVR